MRRILLAVALGLILAIPAGRAQANLILNGSFESPLLSSGQLLDLSAGSNVIPNWTILGSDILLLQTNYSEPANGISAFTAQDGLNSVDLTGAFNTGPTDGVSQTVATVSGTSYTLTFYVGRASSSSGFYLTPATVGLSINGGAQTMYTNSNLTTGTTNWELFTVNFMATGSSTNIAFFNDTPSATAYAGLDNVTLLGAVASVPEPSSLVATGSALMILWLGFASRRAKRDLAPGA